MEIGRKILNLRKDQGVHQRDLAHDSHVTPSALSRIEAGIHTPRGKVTLEIARRLGTTADYVLDETAPYPPPRHMKSSRTSPIPPRKSREKSPR